MLLKRLYDHSGEQPRVSGIKVLRAGPRQKFSTRFIEGGSAEGWLSMTQGKVILHGSGGDVVYRIERAPGYYCCHCERKLDDGPGGRVHVETAHAGKASPDPSNPSGFRRDNFFACVREA